MAVLKSKLMADTEKGVEASAAADMSMETIDFELIVVRFFSTVLIYGRLIPVLSLFVVVELR